MTKLHSSPRSGMTLIEMLVATTCTLILMGAIAQVFGAFGTAVSDSRSMIELDARLRSVAWRLRNDLNGATARTVPPLEVEAGEGYFEVIEGPRSDSTDATGAAIPRTELAADIDDVLLFTTRNTETPYLGKYDYGSTKMTESQLAEVGWFLRPTDTTITGIPQTYTLFRRQNLVLGYVGFSPFYGKSYPNAVVYDAAAGYPNNPNGNNSANNYSAFSSWRGFFDCFDISVQVVGTAPPFLLVPNSLADLTRRETRFMHNPNGLVGLTAGKYRWPDGTVVPNIPWQASPPPDGLIFDITRGSTRGGEDAVLTNVLAFDVRVFDPGAPVNVAVDVAIVPGDSGFAPAAQPSANGAYVDLGWNRGISNAVATSGLRPRFADLGDSRSGLQASGTVPRVWDTWSTHYESNGLDDDGDGVVDQGSDGLDNDGDGKVDESPFDADGDGTYTNDPRDDWGELETLPPYRFPLRGIEIRLRCYEPSSRQVRQVTIRHSFVPR
jgi:type II secretory pathway component PulJ